MEFILELLFEIIVEGSIELSTHKKVPMPLRIMAFIICFGLFGFIAGGITVVGFNYLAENNIGGAIFFFAVSLLLIIAFIYAIHKTYKENNSLVDDNSGETHFGEAKPSNKRQTIIAGITAIIFVIICAYVIYTFDL